MVIFQGVYIVLPSLIHHQWKEELGSSVPLLYPFYPRLLFPKHLSILNSLSKLDCYTHSINLPSKGDSAWTLERASLVALILDWRLPNWIQFQRLKELLVALIFLRSPGVGLGCKTDSHAFLTTPWLLLFAVHIYSNLNPRGLFLSGPVVLKRIRAWSEAWIDRPLQSLLGTNTSSLHLLMLCQGVLSLGLPFLVYLTR